MRTMSAARASMLAVALSATSACSAQDSSTPVGRPTSGDWRIEHVEESITGLWSEHDDVFSVGNTAAGGTIAHWNGAAWQRIEKPTTQFVVSGTGARDVWVGGRGAILHYAGASWSMLYTLADARASVGAAEVLSLATLSGEIWFGGERMRVNDGQGQAVVGSLFHVANGGVEALDCCGSEGRIDGIWASGSASIWVLDHGAPVRFDGVKWTRPHREGTAAIRKVWGTSSRDVWLVGDDFAIEHWDGDRLSSIALPPGTGMGALNDVSGTGPSDVWAVGTSGTVVHFDGVRWSSVPIPTTAALSAVHVGARVWIGGEHVVASTLQR